MKNFIILFFLFFVSNVNAKNIEIFEKDTLLKKSIHQIRENFWNNLPKALGWTNDFENIFSDTEQTKLDSIVAKFERETSIEIAIVTIDTLKTSKEKFDDLTLHIAQSWKIGKVNLDNGLLIGISKEYRKIRIQNGKGIEKILSDGETKMIIDNFFIPMFKKGEYYQGTFDGLNEIIRVLKDKMNK